MNQKTFLNIFEVRDCWPACELLFLWTVLGPDGVGHGQGKEVGGWKGWDLEVQHALLGGRGLAEFMPTCTPDLCLYLCLHLHPHPQPCTASHFPPFLGPPVERGALSCCARPIVLVCLLIPTCPSTPRGCCDN